MAAQIPEKMQAVVCHGPHDYRLEEVAVPQRGPGEALIKVEAVGICASDLKCYHGAAKFWGDENRPAWAETMVIPGHEFAGRVVDLDDAAASAGGSRSGTGWCPSRSCRAGNAASASAASTTCVSRTTSTASSGARPARWPATWCIRRRHWCTRCLPMWPPSTPRSPSRCRARCTPWSARRSCSKTSWWWPGVDPSVWAWWPVPAPRTRCT